MNSLKNKKILITKSREDAEIPFAELVEEGADIIYFPTIKIISKVDSDEIHEALSKSYEFDYIIFTSVNAAEVFHTAVEKYKLDLAHCKIAAVGKSTAERCRGLGFYVHIIPHEFNSRGLIRKFSKFDITNKKILIPCSSLSRDDLKLGLTEMGAEVVSLSIYDVAEINPEYFEEAIVELSNDKPDIFVFTSPSSFENFLKIMNVNDIGTYFESKFICSIGTTTERAIRSHNLTVNIVPFVFSLEGIADAILKYFKITSDLV